MQSESTSVYVTIQDNLNACSAVQNGNTSQMDREKLCAQLNLNSRLAQTQKLKDATLDDTIAHTTKTIAKTDKTVLDLLSSGLLGGEVERARQILQKFDPCNVSIDRDSSRLLLHDRDLGLTVFDILNDPQTTKNLGESTLGLVERLKFPALILANTIKTCINRSGAL